MDELVRGWSSRNSRILAWHNKLFDSAYDLRNEVESQLKPSPAQVSISDGELRNVIECYEPEGRQRLFRDAHSAIVDEVLRFSIGVLLDRTVVMIPVACRANHQRIEWCMWDSDQAEAGRVQSWAPNAPAVAEWIIARIELSLKWDPMHGPDFKAGLDLQSDDVMH